MYSTTALQYERLTHGRQKCHRWRRESESESGQNGRERERGTGTEKWKWKSRSGVGVRCTTEHNRAERSRRRCGARTLSAAPCCHCRRARLRQLQRAARRRRMSAAAAARRRDHRRRREPAAAARAHRRQRLPRQVLELYAQSRRALVSSDGFGLDAAELRHAPPARLPLALLTVQRVHCGPAVGHADADTTTVKHRCSHTYCTSII